METDVIRWFQLVADGATVTEVAEIHLVSQPQVSRALAALQEEVGAALLTKSGRILRLTHAGMIFKEHADRVIATLDDGIAAIDQLMDPERGTIVLAYEPWLGTRLVPEFIRTFREHHPDVRFVLRLLDERAELPGPDYFVTNRIDLALSGTRPQRIPMQWQRLFSRPLFLAVSTTHPYAARTTVALADLAEENLIRLPASAPLTVLIDSLLEQADVAPAESIQANDLPTIRGLVRAGLGVAIIPSSGVPVDAVRLIPIDGPEVVREIGMAWPSRRRLLPAARLFREHLATSSRAIAHTTA